MTRIQPTPKPHPASRVTPRPLPAIFRQAYGSEEEATNLVQTLEHDPLFRILHDEGIIRKLRVLGTIPYDQYALHMIERAVEFVKRHDLDRHSEWKHALLGHYSHNQLSIWAQDWQVPEEELRRVLWFLRLQPQPARGMSQPLGNSVDQVPGANEVAEPEDVIEVAQAFVRRYHLTQQDFIDYVLSGDYGSAELAGRFKCSLQEAEQLQEVLTRLELRKILMSSEPHAGSQNVRSAADQIVAQVQAQPGKELLVRFLDEQATVCYSIDHAALEAWRSRTARTQEVRSLLGRIRAVNERFGAVRAIIHRVCALQKEFIASSDPLDLRPVTQAEVARHVGCHRSVVSRVIRAKVLQTDHGQYALSEFMPGMREVIELVAEAHPEWTDQEISEYLSDRFGIRLSRRGVNYHRQPHAEAGPDRRC
jgi:sigma-54-like protein